MDRENVQNLIDILREMPVEKATRRLAPYVRVSTYGVARICDALETLLRVEVVTPEMISAAKKFDNSDGMTFGAGISMADIPDAYRAMLGAAMKETK